MIFATFLIVLTMCLTRNKDHVTNKVIRNKPSTIYMKTRVLVAKVFNEHFVRIKNIAQNICDTNKITTTILEHKTISTCLNSSPDISDCYPQLAIEAIIGYNFIFSLQNRMGGINIDIW